MVTNRSANVTLPNIITHKDQIRQANFPQSERKIGISPDFCSDTHLELTETQRYALALYDLGLNVFPQPLGKKGGWPWKQLCYTRLERDHAHYGIERLFYNRCNIAIMCGRTSGNLFIIDCESAFALDYHTSQARERGIALWVVKTARGGHIYLRAKEGEVKNIESGQISEAEIKGQNGYILTAPSVHPDGTIYEWLYRETESIPEIHIKQINWLQDKTGKSISLEATTNKEKMHRALNRRYPDLSLSTQDYIQNGHLIAEGTRNNRLFSAACDFAGNHYPKSTTKDILRPIAIRSGLTEQETDATIESAYSKQRTPARPKNKLNHHEWEYALAYSESKSWEGRKGNSRRALFNAFIKRAKESTREDKTFRASIRELSTLSRLGTATIQRLLKNDMKDLVEQKGTDDKSGATLWSFTSNVIQEGIKLKMNTLPPSPPWLDSSVSTFNLGDFCERGALGQGGFRLYCVMLSVDAPMMPSQLAVAAKMRVHQVNYALSKLKSFGLVSRVASGWVARVRTLNQLELDVSIPSGTYGKGEVRRRRYARERRLFVGRLLLQAQRRFLGSLWKEPLSDEEAHAALVELAISLGGVVLSDD